MYRMFVTDGVQRDHGHRLVSDGNPECLAKFYEGTKYAVMGAVTQRHFVKIA
jgi:hypothetical protein